MSETNDQLSDTSSDFNWPIDHPMDPQQQHDRVVFENVADQYAKGEDVTAFFTILQDIKVNPENDEIGLLRIGSTNTKECLAYARVQFNPSTTSGSTRHGTATFPSASLPVTDDEFYQFCYIINKTKNLGSSIPFQLNCTLDDIDLLSNVRVGKSKADGLVAFADQDNDDLVVVHTKRMLTEEKLRQENRHLLDMNRRLESQRDECHAKLEGMEEKTKEHMCKITNDMKTLTASHKTAIDELSSRQQTEAKLRAQLDTCQELCASYQTDSLQCAARCQAIEDAHAKITNESNQVRSQLAVTAQLAKDQATQIINLERHLMQSNELAKTSNQRQTTLEQQLRDLRLTSEKHQLSIEAQLRAYTKQISQQTAYIQTLEADNILLKTDVNARKVDNERLTSLTRQDKDCVEDLQQQLDLQLVENEAVKQECQTLRQEVEEMKVNQEAYVSLNSSFTEIKKRCVKHQKTEIEVKRQLVAYQQFIDELQREKEELKERLATGAEEYKTLFRKLSILEHSTGVSRPQETTSTTTSLNEPSMKKEDIVPTLINTHDHQVQEQSEPKMTVPSPQASFPEIDGEVRKCPLCFWEFPQTMLFQAKQEHIEHHFD